MKRPAGLGSSRNKKARTAAPAQEVVPALEAPANANSEAIQVETTGSAVDDLNKLKEQANEAEDAVQALDWCRGIIHESDRLLRNKGAAAQEDVLDGKDWARVHAIYGWALQQFSDVPAELCKNEEKSINRLEWLEQADEQYLLAFKLASGHELPIAAHLEHALLCLCLCVAQEGKHDEKANLSLTQSISRLITCMSLHLLPDANMTAASREEELEIIAQMLPLLDEMSIDNMAQVAPHLMHLHFVAQQVLYRLGDTTSPQIREMQGNIALACSGRYAEDVEELLHELSEEPASDVWDTDLKIIAGRKWARDGQFSGILRVFY